jgi:hypothetical protein
MSSSLRKLKAKIEKKNKKPRKAPVYNREDGPQCDVCLRRFSDERWLRNHKARIHEGKTSKDFECPKCRKKFSYKSALTRHNKTVHLKLRDHVCEVCGRAFGQNGDLQKHIRRRHDKIRSADDGDGESDGSEDETVDDPFPEDTAALHAPMTTPPDAGPVQATAPAQDAPARRVQTIFRS